MAQAKWLPLFKKYIRNLRIQSKHAEEDLDGEGIELKLWTSQTRVLEQICEGLEEGVHCFYVLKSRQLGVTTITIAIILFWLALHPNTIGCLVSDNDKNYNKNRATVRKYMESLASFMGKSFGIVKDNKFGFEFSNKSRLDLLVAGRKVNWGEGEGYIVGHLTELASYGKEEGIGSFRHAMAPDNPRALYIFESTAHGPNHWKDMWEAARGDPYSSRCIFVGWWSNDLQKISVKDRRFAAFGAQPPTPEESEKIRQVKDLYGHDITMEQLAWYRLEKTKPNSNESDMDQNQSWTESDCFIQTGVSFFYQKLIHRRREEITSAPPVGVDEGGYAYKAMGFFLADEYHQSSVEFINSQISSDQIKLRVWEQPVADGQYIIGVDPAGGRSEVNNYHCASVWRAFADKLVQVAEWADGIPETRHVAWVTAYLAGQYKNCRINIDLTGGVGGAVAQAFEDLRRNMRSDMYQKIISDAAVAEMERKQREDPDRPMKPQGMGVAPTLDFDDFLTAANWYLYRRIDSPGPGYQYHTKMSYNLKRTTMNILRDSWVSGLLEIRSVPLLDEMVNVVQTDLDIGASAPGKLRDDRTFAMALANSTWVENLRPGLVMQGITWDSSRAKEQGLLSPTADKLNKMVFNIMRAADEMRDLPPPRTFFEMRGLS